MKLVAPALALAVVGSLVVLSFRWLPLYGPIPLAVAALSGLAVVGAAVVALGLAAVIRQRWAIAAAGVSVVLALVLVVTAVNPVACITSPSATGDVVIYSHNVKWGTGSVDSLATEVELIDPDLVVLQEADGEAVELLASKLDANRYPHLVRSRGEGTLSLAVFSAWPLTDVVDTADGWETANPSLTMVVERPDGEFSLTNVHFSAPNTTERTDRRRNEFAAAAEIDSDVLVGDFNSTAAHRRFRSLIGDTYIDAHVAVRCGPTTTWRPLGRGPGLLHLDHVLLRRGAASPATASVGGFHESDHRAIVVSFELSGA